eukprot:GHRR01029019.1.p2 GENE.GHRR01029019.1~~GHRR01029019.1.p2  ORF type:complete len:104 (+),score=8.82 GHRR01029019.1:390-701(+)
MHAAGLRASPVSACGRCRHVASAAQHRHPVAPRRVVAVRATLPAQGEDQVASQALQEYFELERTGSMTALTVENLRWAQMWDMWPIPFSKCDPCTWQHGQETG